jgi:hypothetical protein
MVLEHLKPLKKSTAENGRMIKEMERAKNATRDSI